MSNEEYKLSEKQECEIFIRTALEILKDKKEYNLGLELIDKFKRLEELKKEQNKKWVMKNIN